MRKQYVIGNWKMHGSKTFVTELLSNIKDFVQKNQSNVNIIVCPPYVFLDQTQIMLKKSQLMMVSSTSVLLLLQKLILNLPFYWHKRPA